MNAIEAKDKIEVEIMELIKINEWLDYFKECKFKNVKKYQFFPKNCEKGTLVIEDKELKSKRAGSIPIKPDLIHLE